MNTPASSTPAFSYAPLFWLALGTFAVGTESFMIAGLLPGMAADLHVSIVATGQLVTVFALAYALSSPVLTALTGGFNRRSLMIGAMVAFAAANVVAWSAQNYWALMAARVLLAAAAGLFVPGANALAGVIAGQRVGARHEQAGGGGQQDARRHQRPVILRRPCDDVGGGEGDHRAYHQAAAVEAARQRRQHGRTERVG